MPAPPAGGGATATARPAGAVVPGAGTTFPNPIYSKWFDHQRETGVGINHQSIGSGGGIRQFTEGTVDRATALVTDPLHSRDEPPGGTG